MSFIPNLTNLQSEAIRGWLLEHPYTPPDNIKNHIQNVELRSIGFSEAFYRLCHAKSKPPTQHRYVKYFLSKTDDELAKRKIEPDDFAPRVMRNWEAYIRELDFILQLRDSSLFLKVEYDLEKDQFEKTDVTLWWGKEAFPVHLYYYSTKRAAASLKWQAKKAKRLHLKNWIDFGVNDLEVDYVGNCALYPAFKIDHLLEIIKKAPNHKPAIYKKKNRGLV